MCLAVPMKIISIEGDSAVAEYRGVESRVNISLVNDLKIDDKVIIHAGFVIEKLETEDADSVEEILQEYEKFLEPIAIIEAGQEAQKRGGRVYIKDVL